MTDSNHKPSLQRQARQGNPKAIAALLNRAFQPQGITVRVKRQQTQLLILLESPLPLDPEAVIGKMVKGFQRLGLQGIERLTVQARQPAATQPAWHTRVAYSSNTHDATLEPTSKTAPEPTQKETKTTTQSSKTDSGQGTPPAIIVTDLADMPAPIVLPGWSFWFGWVIAISLCTGVAAVLSALTGYGTFAYFLRQVLTGCAIGIAQWWILRQDVSWAKAWLEATVVGVILSAIVSILSQWLIVGELTGTLFPLKITVLLLRGFPLLAAQWYVLQGQIRPAASSSGLSDRVNTPTQPATTTWKQSFSGGNLWPWVMGGFAVFSSLGRGFLPSGVPPFALSSGLIFEILGHMLSGGTMVYILRHSQADLLKLNRYTDADTRRRLLAQRERVNGLFFLAWSGLTLCGWAVGGILQAILSPLVITRIFTLSVMLSTITVFQWIALRKQFYRSPEWYRKTAAIAFICPLVIGLGELIFGGLLLSAFGSNALPGSMLFASFVGIGVIGMMLSLFAVIAVQSNLLKKRGYRSLNWLVVHLIILFIMVFKLSTNLGYLIPGIVALFIFAPGATMIWILGYPKLLQSTARV